jgi:hypothetical protein
MRDYPGLLWCCPKCGRHRPEVAQRKREHLGAMRALCWSSILAVALLGVVLVTRSASPDQLVPALAVVGVVVVLQLGLRQQLKWLLDVHPLCERCAEAYTGRTARSAGGLS